MACVGLVGCVCFLVVVAIEIPLLQLELPMTARSRPSVRRHGSGELTRDAVAFGLWDEHGRITPLQLRVALSMALRVDEQHVAVIAEQNHFFSVQIFEDLDSILELTLQPEFQELLNIQTRIFGGIMIVSRAPVVVFVNKTR